MKRYDANAVAAIAATVTALAALVVAVWDNVQSRAYNRASVQPILVVDARRSTSDSMDEGEYAVSNQGVGPAVIKNVRIFFDPIAESGAERELATWASLAAELRELGFVVTGWTDVAPDRPLGVDRSITLFTFQIERVDGDGPLDHGSGVEAGRVEVQTVFDAVSLEIVYESVYGEAFSVGTDGVGS